jgi:hypothetical protein
VLEYVEDLKNGDSFPPVVVFYDGTDFWLCDGFHRVEAAFGSGLTEIAALVKQGTRRDAILYSVGANAKHGLRRSNADKRRAVMTLLEDGEWNQWSNMEISRRCCVDEKTVRNLRKSLTSDFPKLENSERTYTTKHGTVATMNTANIGKSQSDRTSELPQPSKSEVERSKPPLWSQVTIKPNHYLSGQEGTITQFPTPQTAIVALSNGDRELIKLQDLEGTASEQITENSSGTQKRQIREGVNYQPGHGGCEYYVRVEAKTWEQLQRYQEELGTATLDGTIARLINNQKEQKKPPRTEDILVNLSSQISHLKKPEKLFLASQLIESDPELLTQLRSKKKLVK